MRSRTFIASILGDPTLRVIFTVKDNPGFAGTLSEEGVAFPGIDEGCNANFPGLDLEGGRAE